MATRSRRRGRYTKTLLELTWSRFGGCETCLSNESYNDLEDIIARLNLNVRERDRLERNLYCPHCGEQLSLLNQVAAYTDEELRDIKRMGFWSKKYAPHFRRFHEFLLKHPSLGGLHPVGRNLAKAVKRTPARIVNEDIWYRARSFKENTSLSSKHFLPPDPQPAGRYNHAGQSALYLAEDSETAAVETLGSREEGRIWIAKIRSKRRLRTLNVTIPFPLNHSMFLPLLLEGIVFTGALRERVQGNERATPEYHVPRYVADLVRLRKLDGVVYTSSKEFPFRPDVFGTNLVILNPDFREFVSIEEYGLYKWHEATFCPPFNLPCMKLEPIS